MIGTITILIASIPLGFWIAWLARDELVAGRAWFQRLIVVSAALGIGFMVYGEVLAAAMFGFIAIIAFISYHKSFDRQWTRLR